MRRAAEYNMRRAAGKHATYANLVAYAKHGSLTDGCARRFATLPLPVGRDISGEFVSGPDFGISRHSKNKSQAPSSGTLMRGGEWGRAPRCRGPASAAASADAAFFRQRRFRARFFTLAGGVTNATAVELNRFSGPETNSPDTSGSGGVGT
jgi:hypothetical protein